MPPHFSAEFWELRAPVVITFGRAARLAVRMACGADSGIPVTQPLKNVAESAVFDITSKGLPFKLVMSTHPSANAPRARRDLLRAATLAGLR